MFERLNKLYKSDKLPWLIIGFGIVLRLVQYLYNHSLFIDEARDTVVGILGRSYADLFTSPLDIHKPTPPLGFFVIEKLAVQFLGDSEYVLRLFPILTSIISIFLFYFFAKQYIKPKAVPIALILFATLEPLIYYSSEVRPYMNDIAIVLIIYLAARYVELNKLTLSRLAFFAVIGSVVIWFSSSSVFILAGVGSTLALYSLIRKEWTRIIRLSLVYSFWVLSLVVCYFVYLHNLTNDEYALNFWRGENGFMPFPPLSFSDIKWFMTTFFNIFQETAGFFLPGIAAFTFIVGCFKTYLEKKEKFFILISPVLFALLASGFYLYPVRHRTLFFMIPSLLLLIAEGVEDIRDKTAQSAPIIGIVLIGLLLFHPLFSAIHHTVKPITKEEIKPVLNYIKKQWQDGDVLYVHYHAHPAFEYYKKKYGFADKDYIVGVYAGDKNDIWAFSVDYLKVYTDDLDKLRGKRRVWILFTATPMLHKGINEEVFFIYYLNTIGKQLDSFKSVEAGAYLYNLSVEALSSSSPRNRDATRTLHWHF